MTMIQESIAETSGQVLDRTEIHIGVPIAKRKITLCDCYGGHPVST